MKYNLQKSQMGSRSSWENLNLARQVNRQIKGRQTPDLDAAFALREQLLEALQIGGNLACGMVSICVLHIVTWFYTCLRGGLRS